MLKHRAKTIPFETLHKELNQRFEKGLVDRKFAPWNDGIELYTYTKQCVYERAWDEYTSLARGLILNLSEKKVLATPFPKFFNLGEVGLSQIPDLPFETFEKVDGSLIIVYHDGERWTTATKGSFSSDQAIWAYQHLTSHLPFEDYFIPEYTYLFEAVYPENRIVVKYDPALVLLGGYDDEGWELLGWELMTLAENLGCRHLESHDKWDSLDDLVAHAKGLPATQEGYVLRFYDGTRVKVKGDEYCRLHRLISGIKPLNIWEMMKLNELTPAVEMDVPEEFRDDFTQIKNILRGQVVAIVARLAEIHRVTARMTDKEVGLDPRIDKTTKGLLFGYRKLGALGEKHIAPGTRLWNQIFEMVRPSGNRLDGYIPSSAMNKIQEDE